MTVKTQLETWETLLDIRIKIQPLMNLANSFNAIKNKTTQKKESAKLLQETLLNFVKKLKTLNSAIKLSVPTEKNPDESEPENNDILDVFKKIHSERKLVLAEWAEKVDLMEGLFSSARLLASKQFKTLNKPLDEQIEEILSDKSRLVKRTQIRRDSQLKESDKANPEVFDDSDFFQRLLKENKRSLADLEISKISDISDISKISDISDISDISKISEISKENKNSAKGVGKVTKRKSKRMRYEVHEKLVHFMTSAVGSGREEKVDMIGSLFKKAKF